MKKTSGRTLEKAKEVIRIVNENPDLSIDKIMDMLENKFGNRTHLLMVSAVRDLYREGFFDKQKIKKL